MGVRPLFFNGELVREVSTAIFGKRRAPKGSSSEEWQANFQKLEAEGARGYVARLLAKQDYATRAIRKKLEGHLVSADAIDQLLSQLETKGYLNDSRLAQNLIDVGRQRGLSDTAIKAKLLAKGLSPTYLEAALPEDPLEIASIAWEKISKRYNISDLKDRQRATAALARRGFSWEIIQSLLTPER